MLAGPALLRAGSLATPSCRACFALRLGAARKPASGAGACTACNAAARGGATRQASGGGACGAAPIKPSDNVTRGVCQRPPKAPAFLMPVGGGNDAKPGSLVPKPPQTYALRCACNKIRSIGSSPNIYSHRRTPPSLVPKPPQTYALRCACNTIRSIGSSPN
jgi:hypothetical protein